MKTKLNILLAKTDHLANSYKSSIKDYIQFFKDKQSAFKGEKKTYEAKPGTIDIPSERGNKMVVTTVSEKLDWLKETNTEFINSLFSQEATNAAGVAKASLTVDGVEFGEFSSLELLRLKSILEMENLNKCIQTFQFVEMMKSGILLQKTNIKEEKFSKVKNNLVSESLLQKKVISFLTLT